MCSSYRQCLSPVQLSVIQGELKTVKEFRRLRAEMEAQLVQLRVSLTQAEQEHQSALQSLEHRFFEEKVIVIKDKVCIYYERVCVSLGEAAERSKLQDCRAVRESPLRGSPVQLQSSYYYYNDPKLNCVNRNLDDRTREIYHENVRMSSALALHTARVEELEQRTQQLETDNRYSYYTVYPTVAGASSDSCKWRRS